MPANRKFTDEELQQALAAGMGICEFARERKVHKSAVSKRAKRLSINLRKLSQKEKVTRDVVLFHAGEIVGKEINAVEQLAKINRHANSVLDGLMSFINGEDPKGEELQAEAKPDLKGRDPRELALKAMGEIRQQISAQFEMLRDLYDMNRVQQFQEEVLAAIGEVEPDVREKIVDNLRRRRVIRAAIRQD